MIKGVRSKVYCLVIIGFLYDQTFYYYTIIQNLHKGSIFQPYKLCRSSSLIMSMWVGTLNSFLIP